MNTSSHCTTILMAPVNSCSSLVRSRTPSTSLASMLSWQTLFSSFCTSSATSSVKRVIVGVVSLMIRWSSRKDVSTCMWQSEPKVKNVPEQSCLYVGKEGEALGTNWKLNFFHLLQSFLPIKTHLPNSQPRLNCWLHWCMPQLGSSGRLLACGVFGPCLLPHQNRPRELESAPIDCTGALTNQKWSGKVWSTLVWSCLAAYLTRLSEASTSCQLHWEHSLLAGSSQFERLEGVAPCAPCTVANHVRPEPWVLP